MWSGGIDLFLGGEGTGGDGRGLWLIVPVSSGGSKADISTWEGGELEVWMGSVGKDSVSSREPLLGLVIKDLLLNENVKWSWTNINR